MLPRPDAVAHSTQQPRCSLAVQRLCHEVRQHVLRVDLLQAYPSLIHYLLHPEVAGVNVLDLS